LAEGVVSEPFLPSGDQGHKGGFAPLPKHHPFAWWITDKTPHKDKPFPNNLGCKTWREHRNFEELRTRLDAAKSSFLAKSSRSALCTETTDIIFMFRAGKTI
jgi:hypothetical protein